MALVIDVHIEKGNLKITGEIPVTSSAEELKAFVGEIKLQLLGDMDIENLPSSGIIRHDLTEAEAARYIGRSKSFLQKCRRDGRNGGRLRGPKYTRDSQRIIRYPVDELDKWLASRNRYQAGCEEHDYSEDRR